MVTSQVSFARVTKQQVVGVLKATGSTDPDVLFAAKESLLGPVKPLNWFGIWAYVTGALATVMIVFAIFGIPLIIFGWWVRKRYRENVETIESAYAEYLRTLTPQRT